MAGQGGGIQLTVNQQGLRDLVRALKAEGDGKALRKELLTSIKAVLQPTRDRARGSVLGLASGGLGHGGEPLAAAVAKKVIVQVRTGGRATGASVKAGKKGMPRDFNNAPRRLNRDKWRHPVWGNSEVWVTQVGKPKWFDDATRVDRGRDKAAVMEILNKMAHRIAHRS